MKRVYIGIFGSGLGHASRMMAVGRRLVEDGCSLQFSSSGEAAHFIRRQGFECNDIPLIDVVFTDTGSFSAKETMKVAPWLFIKVFKQAGVETSNMMRFAPDVVLSDSLLSTVMASRLLGIRSVTVLNQLKLISSPGTPRIAGQLLTNGSITIGNEFWELSDSMLFPDLPPPYTISELNLWGTGSVGRRAEYIGFLTAPKSDFVDPAAAEIRDSRRKVIFWQVSGPAKTRTTLLTRFRKLAASLKQDYLSVISGGNPGGNTRAQDVEGGVYYEWCPSKDALLDRSDVFVSRAGHATISDLILRGKPSVLVPIRSQMEQMGNAEKAARLGVAADLSEDRLTEDSLRDAIRMLESEETIRRVKALQAYASGFDAAGSIVSALRN